METLQRFFFIFLICIALIGLSIINIYREKYADPTKVKQFTYIRYMAAICCILQFQCFLGYLLNNVGVTQSAWGIWIPLATLTLAQVSINVSQSYVDIVKMKNDTISKPVVFGIYIAWLFASIFNTTGSILGFSYSILSVQFFCYASWKLSEVLSLSFSTFILYKVCRKCKKSLEFNYNHNKNDDHDVHSIDSTSSNSSMPKDYLNSITLERIRSGVFRMQSLIICFMLLIIILTINLIQEYVSFFQVVLHTYDQSNYTDTPTITVALIYMPIWTFVQLVNLIYSWILFYQFTKQYRINLGVDSEDVSKTSKEKNFSKLSNKNTSELSNKITSELSPVGTSASDNNEV